MKKFLVSWRRIRPAWALPPWLTQRRPVEPIRRWVRRALLVFAVAIIVPSIYPGQAVGQAHVDRGGTVGIKNQTERDLFFSLICQCGCPRETLGTCSCDYASARRSELRDMLDQGLGVQAIQKAYSDRFGTKALAVPPNEGAGLLIWAFPLVAFIVAAILIARVLRRWTGRGRELRLASLATAGAPLKAVDADEKTDAPAKRDEYDDRLDDELKDLDRG